MKLFIIVISAALVAGVNLPVPTSVGAGEQVAHGKALFNDRCASCHGMRMEGGDVAPTLRSPSFTSEWRGRPASDLVRRIRTTMPQNAPGTLDAVQAAAVTAAILRANDLHAGPAQLPSSLDEQKKTIITS